MKKLKGACIVILCVISIATTAVVLWRVIVDDTFNRAITMAGEGEYFDSAELFSIIKNRKGEAISEFIIDFTNQLCEEQQFYRANSWISAVSARGLITVFQDKQYKATVDDQKAIFVSENNYAKALAAYEEGRFIEAYHQFKQLNGYDDSEARAEDIFETHKKIFYEFAVEICENKSYWQEEKAVNILTKLGDYENSPSYLVEIGTEWINDPQYCYSKLTIDDKVDIWNRTAKYDGPNVDAFWKQIETEYNITEEHLWAIIADSNVIDAVEATQYYRETTSSDSISYDAILMHDGGKIVAALSVNSLNEHLQKLENTNTESGMFDDGQVAYIDVNTKVAVISKELPATKVRILEGIYDGVECWVISDAVIECN